MTLQGKSAAAYYTSFTARLPGYIIGFCIIHYCFIIQFYNYMFALYFKIFLEPFIVFYKNFLYILYAIEAACSPPVGMAIIYLHLISFFGPVAFLVGCVKINTRIGAGCCHYIG